MLGFDAVVIQTVGKIITAGHPISPYFHSTCKISSLHSSGEAKVQEGVEQLDSEARHHQDILANNDWELFWEGVSASRIHGRGI